MHRSSAIGITAALPFLALGFHLLTTWLPPIIGYGAGLALYWGVLAGLILAGGARQRLQGLMRARWPGRWPALVLALVLAGLLFESTRAVAAAQPQAWLLGGALVAAVLNGTLEELFWRGTLLARPLTPPRWPALIGSLALFVTWHVALLFANGINVTGGAAGLLGGAAALGALFLALRLSSASVATPALAHIAVNALAFAALVAANPL